MADQADWQIIYKHEEIDLYQEEKTIAHISERRLGESTDADFSRGLLSIEESCSDIEEERKAIPKDRDIFTISGHDDDNVEAGGTHVNTQSNVNGTSVKSSITAVNGDNGTCIPRRQGSNSGIVTGTKNAIKKVVSTIRAAIPEEQNHELPTEAESKYLFSTREGAFETAVEECKKLLLSDLDGDIRGAWLLAEIDHWDNERERLVLITDHQLMMIKYDFITLRVLEVKRIMLFILDKIIVGKFQYPVGSVMPRRSSSGVRVLWNDEQPITFMHNWNPWSREIPWITLKSHPLFRYKDREAKYYDVEVFADAIIQSCNQAREVRGLTDIIKVSYSPIVIENYAGVMSAVHNFTRLGYFKVRGRVSF